MSDKLNWILQLLFAASLLLLVAWGRSETALNTQNYQTPALQWSDEQSLLHKAIGGAVPGFAADIKVLNIFDTFALSQKRQPDMRQPLWNQMFYQIMAAQSLDPWFRDVYRLTEGLLAYEAGKAVEAIAVLQLSELYLNSGDPLLVASFLALRELHNDTLAIDLAKRAASKADSSTFAVSFAAGLIHKQNGCELAIAFLQSRLLVLPEEYRQSIHTKIQQIQQSEECLRGNQASHL